MADNLGYCRSGECRQLARHRLGFYLLLRKGELTTNDLRRGQLLTYFVSAPLHIRDYHITQRLIRGLSACVRSETSSLRTRQRDRTRLLAHGGHPSGMCGNCWLRHCSDVQRGALAQLPRRSHRPMRQQQQHAVHEISGQHGWHDDEPRCRPRVLTSAPAEPVRPSTGVTCTNTFSLRFLLKLWRREKSGSFIGHVALRRPRQQQRGRLTRKTASLRRNGVRLFLSVSGWGREPCASGARWLQQRQLPAVHAD